MRPQRLYKTDAGRYYFIIDGKRKYIKIPKGMTEAELMKLNTKTILQTFGRRLKKRKKRKAPKFQKPIINGELGKKLSVDNEKTASSAFVQQGKPITEIAEVLGSAKASEETKKGFKKLIDIAGKSMQGLLKGSTFKDQKQIKNSTEAETELKPAQKKLLQSTQRDILKLENQIENEIRITKEQDKPKRRIGKSLGKEPEVRPTTLYKIMLKNILEEREEQIADNKKPTFAKIPTLEQANNLIKSDKLELSKSIYNKSIQLLKDNLERIDESDLYNETSSASPLTETEINDDDEKKPKRKKKIIIDDDEESNDGDEESKTADKTKKYKYTELSDGMLLEETASDTPSTTAPKKRKQTKVGEDINEGRDIVLDETASDTPSVAKEVDKAMGFGGVEEGGLYNDEIAKVIRKRVGEIVPVIPIDKVNSLLNYVVKGDKKFAAVVNTNPSTSDGSGSDGYRPGHWRGIYINNEDDFPSVEYFDPLVEGPPEPQLVRVMRKLCKKIAPEKMCLYKQNAIRRQAKEKSTCGWHTMQFIDDRWNGVPWSEATGYDDYIENLPGPVDGSQDGEADVSKYIKKYKVYL